VCTRNHGGIAAISVADRVAKERGETLGKGVNRRPGAIPMLDTRANVPLPSAPGIFLKSSDWLSLEMHWTRSRIIIVNEVHERDVDNPTYFSVVLQTLIWQTGRREIFP